MTFNYGEGIWKLGQTVSATRKYSLEGFPYETDQDGTVVRVADSRHGIPADELAAGVTNQTRYLKFGGTTLQG